jgi:hypothetical protein
MWKLAEERVGRKPDSLMVVKLKATLPQVGELSSRYMWELLDSHKARLRENEANDVWKRKQYRRVRRGIKKYPQIDLALEALALKGQTHEQVLEETIPGIAYVVERIQPLADGKLAGQVASQICREGIEQPHVPGKVFAPGPEHLLGHADELGLTAFADRELLEWRAQEANVTEREWESFVLGTLYGNQAAAEICGRSANQVGVEKFRAENKLRPPA